ncbi:MULTISPECIES: universal stress protein [Clostridia]|uniref:universal stress protein n=1 Tax=Clostridia TaxID=186801 RepID=UPI000EA0D540|nr:MULTISPECIES: universal stress protein [Clostridia]NBJ69237.1 universal stress protein [Roseburia sp. 1XD42-34]RKI79206.1 universal stress protein [Clostridium sp. 1xD42-85]
MAENILVAYDGSELSRKAVEEAKKQAKLVKDAVVYAVTVITHAGPTANAALARSFMGDMAEEIRPSMERIREEFEAEGINCKAEVLLDYSFRNPSSQIVEYAKENQIDLIILGSRGLGGVGRFLLGSVSSQIVQRAECKVLVVK